MADALMVDAYLQASGWARLGTQGCKCRHLMRISLSRTTQTLMPDRSPGG